MDLRTESPRDNVVALAVKWERVRSIDRVTAEIVAALAAAGIRAIVLKGPVFASWLYGDGAFRSYGDSDLMVAPSDSDAAIAVLRSLGFKPYEEYRDVYSYVAGPKHACCWARGGLEGDQVDLHTSLAGVTADPDLVWAAVTRDAEVMTVGGQDVEVTGPAANALIVALHAATNGPRHERSLEDLRRALEVTDDATWSAAAVLASEIDSEGAFGAGLKLVPPGRELADRLDLAGPAGVEILLRAGGAPDGAIFIDKLAETPSWRVRLKLLARAAVPTASYMRGHFPLAQRGRAGLVAAYWVRAVRRLVTAVPALLAVAAARGTARDARQAD